MCKIMMRDETTYSAATVIADGEDENHKKSHSPQQHISMSEIFVVWKRKSVIIYCWWLLAVGERWLNNEILLWAKRPRISERDREEINRFYHEKNYIRLISWKTLRNDDRYFVILEKNLGYNFRNWARATWSMEATFHNHFFPSI